MSKGVDSPWTKRREDPLEKAERTIEESLEGAPRREITFDGRAFQIVVAFFSLERDQKLLSGYAHDALGRAVKHLLTCDGSFLDDLNVQSIYLDHTKVMGPKVTMTLGPVTLYAKASSFKPAMAQLMALDRLALAISDAKGRSKKIKDALKDCDVVVARKV